ncbi:DpnD/PcfM family protein [Psychrobacter sp. SWN149]|uniref:DpnD/PcfM family protein n=1 Tax=Psychrobacter sp. SWN149 TaxID=2792057 RepID=UPI001D124694|nr:DpnD/PcfM family protein [Psychrobacter sp. SWN149]
MEMNTTKKDEKAAQKFQIELVETLSNIVEVVAEDKQSALLKVQEMYRSEQVILYPDEFIDTKFNIIGRG